MLITRGLGYNQGTALQECRSFYIVWDGTGVDDIQSTWHHVGEGIEASSASFRGTNGLFINNITSGTSFKFYSNEVININNFNKLNFKLKLLNNSPINIYVKLVGPSITTHNVKLSNYINIVGVDVWQDVYIDISNFIINTTTADVNEIVFTFASSISLCIDYVQFTNIIVEKILLDIDDPELKLNVTGEYFIDGNELVPGIYSNNTSNRSIVLPNIRKIPKPKLM